MVVGSQTWFAVTLLTAMLDWIAVGLALWPLEYLAKPATLAATMATLVLCGARRRILAWRGGLRSGLCSRSGETCA